MANEAAQMEMLRVLEAPKAMSEVSFATSIADISDEGFSIPSVPIEAEDGTPFLCPYCFRFQRLKREGLEYHWRKHVLQDLEPYICTFSSCGLDTFRSQHAWFEHELLIHRSRWVCPECSTDFRSSHDLKEHVSQYHHGLVSKRQLSAFIDQSKRSVESIQPSECPFCDDSWARADSSFACSDDALFVNPDQFRRHVGKHMEQVALFSLPRLVQEKSNSLGAQDDADLRNWDNISIGCRWIRDDCGRGWSIVSRKRITFFALAYVLNLRQALKISNLTASNPEKPDGGDISTRCRWMRDRWIRDDCGKGWDIVSRREITFHALACVLNLRQALRDLGPLEIALEQNNEELMLQQLRRNININTQTKKFRNVLREVFRKGYTEVFRRLMDQGAGMTVEIIHYHSALQAASFHGHMAMVQLFLDRGADINAQGGDYGSALQAACYWETENHEAIVRLLLDQGAEMNVETGDYGNALQVASFEGHETIVRLLLDRGMDVNMQGGEYGNALQAALYARQVQIVQLLLNYGASINAQGGHFGNALQAAALDKVNTVQLLLDRGADVNAQGGLFGSALQAAQWTESVNTMQILLDHGADPIGLDLTKYALITMTGSTTDQKTYTDRRFVIGLLESVGHLKDRMIEKLPEVQQTLAANPTWSAMLVHRDEVLDDESCSCGEAGIENGSRLLWRINQGQNSDK